MKDQIYGDENTGLSKCDNVSLISSKLGWGSSIFASKMNKPLQGMAPTWTPSNGMCFHKCSLMCFLGCFLLGALLSSLLSALFSAFLCTCTYIELLWMHRSTPLNSHFVSPLKLPLEILRKLLRSWSHCLKVFFKAVLHKVHTRTQIQDYQS